MGGRWDDDGGGGVSVDSKILGFSGMLKANQTGLSNNTDYNLDLTADVDPKDGWSAANNEYTVPSDYDGKKCFASGQVRVNDSVSGQNCSIGIWLDKGDGYKLIANNSVICPINGYQVIVPLPYQFIDFVSSGDKIKITGNCYQFNTDNEFIGDTDTKYTFGMIEFL